MVRIAGRPVAEVKVADNVAWTVSRDRGLTYADAPEGTEVLAGEWWPADYAGPPLVSIDEEIAAGYGVGLGDTLTFNVLGRNLEARIASIRREVDWSAGRSTSCSSLTRVPWPARRTPSSRQSTCPRRRKPPARPAGHATCPTPRRISLREVVGRATEVLGRFELAVDIVAGLTLGGGILALVGGIMAARAAAALRDRGPQGAWRAARRADAGLSDRVSRHRRRGRPGRGAAGSLAAWILVTQLMTMAWSPDLLALVGVWPLRWWPCSWSGARACCG